MRTLILSDLHLGGLSRSDLLRRAELRAPLLELAAGVERVVLLGDVLELRHGPVRDAMDAARPFFEDLGRALGDGELIVTAGNHDHALVEPWLAARGAELEPHPLGVEQLLEPAQVSPALERISTWVAPARMRVAYPGLWVRPDVYATHGHYLDCHLTVPTLERLSVGVMSRVLGRSATTFDCVDDYESVSAPVFAWRDAVARDAHTGDALNGIATVSAWRTLGGGDNGSTGPSPPLRSRRGSACAARSRSHRRLPCGRRRAQPRRAGAAPCRGLYERAASGRTARDGRGGRTARPRRLLRGLRAHPSHGPATGR
jgi:hypothetical protein